MGYRYVRHLQVFLVAFDTLSISAAVYFAALIVQIGAASARQDNVLQTSVLLAGTWLLVAALVKLYNSNSILSVPLFSKRSMVALLCSAAVVTACLLFLGQLKTLGSQMVAIMILVFLVLVCNRSLYLLFYWLLRQRDFFKDRIIVVGYNSTSKKFIEHLEASVLNKRLIGICDEKENVCELTHYPILGSISDAFDVCRKYNATEIYSAIAPESNRKIYRLIQLADKNCIHFRIIPDSSLFIKNECYIDDVNGLPVFSLRNEPLLHMNKRIQKKIFDVALSLFVLFFILSWLVPIVALAIVLESGGPVLFQQARSGKGNRIFRCLKFRSMTMNGLAHVQQATKNDPRLTRVGKFLRRTSLDELPQFINVLRGDMSVIGPRPHMVRHTFEYSRKIDDFMIRHLIKPGITGWAQVNGCRGEINSVEDLRARIKYDLWYLENWNLWLDIKIVFLTVYNVIKGDKNAF